MTDLAPTCPACSSALSWREPTDTFRSKMLVRCNCTDIDFDRAELAATSSGPEAGLYQHPSNAEVKQDGRDLRADIIEFWGAGALAWIERKADMKSP